jgi:UTP--glucose-1-phosphate uridylyltransferase
VQTITTPSAKAVHKAIVPAAGLGTRHFPASHAMKKEMFPVVGPDGIARALIHYHVLELSLAGIDEICIIVQPGDDTLIKAYFDGPPDDYLQRLEKYPLLFNEAMRMRKFSESIRFVVQKEQEGFGHAVFQARNFANQESVLLCLGDHLFRGEVESPYQELANMANLAHGKSVSAVNMIFASDLKGYGTIAGRRRPENSRIIDVDLIIEKPDIETAQQKLHVNGLQPGEYLGWFGMHLLGPSIFDILEEMIRNNVRDTGEFQLTRAQEIQRQREGYLALEMTGAERFDFGIPDDFVTSLQAFRAKKS